MPEFIPLISEEEIKARVQETGEKISKDYKKYRNLPAIYDLKLQK
jgi:hypoxanthine-guanine phosphoribosyltransferase